MNADEAREFMRHNHRAVLTTRRSDGSPQLSPILVTVDAEGFAIISSRQTAMKTRNLRRDARASICVMNDRFFGRWVQVDGNASIVPLPGALDGLVDYYRRTVGEHPDWDEYRAAMRRERRVLIRVAIERAGPDRAG